MKRSATEKMISRLPLSSCLFVFILKFEVLCHDWYLIQGFCTGGVFLPFMWVLQEDLLLILAWHPGHILGYVPLLSFIPFILLITAIICSDSSEIFVVILVITHKRSNITPQT